MQNMVLFKIRFNLSYMWGLHVVIEIEHMYSSLVVHLKKICWLCLVIFYFEVFRYNDYICQYDGVKCLIMITIPNQLVYYISAIVMNVKLDDFE